MGQDLKTLKDFDEWDCGCEYESHQCYKGLLSDLQEAAKKWYKHLKDYDYEDVDGFFTGDPGEVVAFIEHFFNLEDDKK